MKKFTEGWTDGRMDGRTDAEGYNIIQPFFKRPYKNANNSWHFNIYEREK